MRLGKVTKDQNAKLQESAINDPPASKEQETLKSFKFARTNLLRTRTDHFFCQICWIFNISNQMPASSFYISDHWHSAICNFEHITGLVIYFLLMLQFCSHFFYTNFTFFFTILNTSLDLSSISLRQFGTLYSHSTRDLRIDIFSELFFVISWLRGWGKSQSFSFHW